MIKYLSQFAIAFASLYALGIGALYLGQRSIQYQASTDRTTAPEAGLAGFQDIVLITPDGEKLVAWWKAPNPGKAITLYFHGNGGSLWNRRDRARSLTDDGRGLLMVSYRGYSGSTGSPTEAGLHTDALTAYDWIAKSYEPSRLVVYGESLGTGVAVRLASDRPVAGVILDAPYTSTAEVASKIYWYAPVGLLMLDQFRSLDIIQKIKAPLLVMHGTKDPVIPIEFGEKLFTAAHEPKTFVRLEGSGHSSNLEDGGLKAVDAFLSNVEIQIASSRSAKKAEVP
ncbi:alpha/beta hydrolase [Microvirga tunisiensis]|uniref:Alpha/beta hydrolase n=2 Tax=Microvirga tunisiensis TaxID=2108360 RepID=A0A5N7MN59_9HYPH|nr:alpha/beta hydrolase [Microvirga tunisiensis]MPR28343.1 alpha/beta hydrolase [Microvirga tunisiensis]